MIDIFTQLRKGALTKEFIVAITTVVDLVLLYLFLTFISSGPVQMASGIGAVLVLISLTATWLRFFKPSQLANEVWWASSLSAGILFILTQAITFLYYLPHA